MTYEEALKDPALAPVYLVVIKADTCLETFGVSPCTATGKPCYNCFHTCKDRANFNKGKTDLRITSADAPLTLENARPYVGEVEFYATEIKKNKLVEDSRVMVNCFDEPDGDVGMDRYVTQREAYPDIPGTFWMKWLARNPNYKGWPLEIYEGFVGLSESEFRQKFDGFLDNISYSRGKVRIEGIDPLRSLKDIKVPAAIDCELTADVDGAQTEITLTSVDEIDEPAPGGKEYVIINKERIGYTGVNATTRQLTGCERGAGGTQAAAHSAGDKVGKVRHYGPKNPFDILKDDMLLTDAGYAASMVNTAEFDYWRDFLPDADVDFEDWIDEPTELRKLYFEIVDLVDAKSWTGEDLKVTIRRNLPNEPGRTYFTLTDEANIISGSVEVNLNEESRLTRVLLYWDKDPLGDFDDVKSYRKRARARDAEAESGDYYGDVCEKAIFCRWLRPGLATEEDLRDYVQDLATRQLWRQRDASTVISLDVHLKDLEIKTGDWVKLTTSQAVNPDGSPIAGEKFQVVKRERKEDRISLKLMRLHRRRILFMAPDDTPHYDQATEEEREYGFMWSDDLLEPVEYEHYCMY